MHQFPSDITTIVASYLEPNLLHSICHKIKYDASQYDYRSIPKHIILIGLFITPLTNLTDMSPHTLRHITIKWIHRTICTKTASFLQHATSVTSLKIINALSWWRTIISYFPNLKTLHLHMSYSMDASAIFQCTKLQTLIISDCSRTINFTNLKKLQNLKRLIVLNTPIINSLFLSECQHIRYLNIKNIQFIPQMIKPKYPRLRKLMIDTSFCPITLSKFPNIKNLQIQNHIDSIRVLPSLPPLPKCKRLTITNYKINDLDFLKGYPVITCITMIKCHILNCNILGQCSNLREIVLIKCYLKEKFKTNTFCRKKIIIINSTMPPSTGWFDGANLSKEIHLSEYDHIDTKQIIDMQDATLITIHHSSITNLTSLSPCKNLSILYLQECNYLTNVTGCSKTMHSIMLMSCPNLNISGLDEYPNLEIVVLDDIKSNLSVLPKCPALRKLGITNFKNMQDLSDLPVCPNIKSIGFNNCPNLTNIFELTHWENLVILGLENCNKILALPVCKNLEYVYVSGCAALIDIDALYECTNLKKIDINECSKLDANVLAKLMAHVRSKIH